MAITMRMVQCTPREGLLHVLLQIQQQILCTDGLRVLSLCIYPKSTNLYGSSIITRYQTNEELVVPKRNHEIFTPSIAYQ